MNGAPAPRPQPPHPGSPAAVAHGCTCPVIDNAHGAGHLGLGREWWIALDCPLHDPDADPDPPEADE